MSDRWAIAVDGGNSKTELALVRESGELLAVTRGPLSSPHHVDVDGCVAVIQSLLDEALEQAGLSPLESRPASVARVLMSGVDFPEEEAALGAAVAAQGWAESSSVGNDVFAILRSGSEEEWGIAVVCGAGMNCVGIAPDGRRVRFPALGVITGDWGGGLELGEQAMAAAARSEDGRGPKTVLEQTVPAHFGYSTPLEVAYAIHVGELQHRRVIELAPLVLALAEEDEAAGAIVARQANEVLAFIRAALNRLELTEFEVEVVLGGSILQSRTPALIEPIERGVLDLAPRARVKPATSPPVVGAALLALDDLGAEPVAKERIRNELGAAVERIRPPVPSIDGGSDG